MKAKFIFKCVCDWQRPRQPTQHMASQSSDKIPCISESTCFWARNICISVIFPNAWLEHSDPGHLECNLLHLCSLCPHDFGINTGDSCLYMISDGIAHNLALKKGKIGLQESLILKQHLPLVQQCFRYPLICQSQALSGCHLAFIIW